MSARLNVGTAMLAVPVQGLLTPDQVLIAQATCERS